MLANKDYFIAGKQFQLNNSQYYMQSKTKVIIQLQQNRTAALCLHPGMTAHELQQLFQASACLNNDFRSSTSKCETPAFLISRQQNLLLDYLLTSSSCTLSKICQIQQKSAALAPPRYHAKAHPRLREESNIDDQNRKTQALHVQIVSAAPSLEKQRGCLSYHLPKSERLLLPAEDNHEKLQFQSLVTLHRMEEGFRHKITVGKQTLKSYNHFEKLMKIREQLIVQSKNHSNIFRELLKASQDKEDLIFWFKYCPALSVKEVLSYNLDGQCKKVLFDKMLAFSVYLCEEGFQKYVKGLIQQSKVDLLLDDIMVDFSENLHLADLNLILQREEPPSLNIPQGQLINIQRRIRNYLTATQKTPYNQNTYTFQDIFIAHFSNTPPTFQIDVHHCFRPQSFYFGWNAKSCQREQTMERNEGTTVKKKFAKQEMTKKRGKSQKTKLRHFQQCTLAARKEKKSNKKKNKSFA